MFECPICKEWLFIRSLCPNCVKIRHICSAFSVEEVILVLDKHFLQKKIEANIVKKMTDYNLRNKDKK